MLVSRCGVIVNINPGLTELHQNFTRYSGINGAIKSCIYTALSHSFSECQSDKSAEFANFSQNRLPWQHPLRYRKKGNSILQQGTFISWKVMRTVNRWLTTI